MTYLDKLMRLKLEHPERFKPGVVTHVIVQHGRKCPMFKGGGDCACDPDIRLRSEMEWKMGLR